MVRRPKLTHRPAERVEAPSRTTARVARVAAIMAVVIFYFPGAFVLFYRAFSFSFKQENPQRAAWLLCTIASGPVARARLERARRFRETREQGLPPREGARAF